MQQQEGRPDAMGGRDVARERGPRRVDDRSAGHLTGKRTPTHPEYQGLNSPAPGGDRLALGKAPAGCQDSQSADGPNHFVPGRGCVGTEPSRGENLTNVTLANGCDMVPIQPGWMPRAARIRSTFASRRPSRAVSESSGAGGGISCDGSGRGWGCGWPPLFCSFTRGWPLWLPG